jgi:hypothetical protein
MRIELVGIMKYIICKTCLSERQIGNRKLRDRSPIGEPAEFERVSMGVAKQPKPEQRFMTVNEERVELAPDIFNCDSCNTEIRQSEQCGAWTVWTDEQNEPPMWEAEYMELQP